MHSIIKLPDAYTYISRGLCVDDGQDDCYIENETPAVRYGRILVEDARGRQGLLNLQGRIAIPCRYDEIDRYTDRFIKVSRPRNTTDGHTAKKNKPGTRAHNREVTLTSDDLGKPLMDALRGYEPRYYGILDAAGNVVLPCDCSEITMHGGHRDPAHDRLLYCLEGRWGVCDLSGNAILPAAFDAMEGHGLSILHLLDTRGADGEGRVIGETVLRPVMVFVARKGNAWGAYYIDGDVLLPLSCDAIECVPHPRWPQPGALILLYAQNGLWRAIDHRGTALAGPAPDREVVLAQAQQTVRPETAGEADAPVHVPENGYDGPGSQLCGTVVSVPEERWDVPERVGYQDARGQWVLPPEYSRIRPIGKKLLMAERWEYRFWNRWQLYDAQGRPLLAEECGEVLCTATGKIVVSPWDWEEMTRRPYLLFYDEDTNRCTKETRYRGFATFESATPLYRISNESDMTYRYGLADGDGNILLPIEYEHLWPADDHTPQSGILGSKNGNWYLITPITPSPPAGAK